MPTEEGEALVVTRRPPRCRFWNLVARNHFMPKTHKPQRRAPLDQRPLRGAPRDGVTIVISRGMTDHPISVMTLDYRRENLAFRWFFANEAHARPEVQLLKVADAPATVT
jgi:hypothetical protein